MVSRSDRGPRKETKKGSKFQYKPRDPAKMKERATAKGGNFDSIFKSGFDTWRPKEGDNTVRILPPMWEDAEHYGYEIFIHKNVGADNSMYLCPSKMKDKYCPICAASKEAKDGGEDDEAKALRATNAFVVWIINRDEKDELPMLWQMSWSQDRDVAALGINKNGKVLAVDHPDVGFDLTLKRQGSGLRTKYYGYSFDREESRISESDKTQDGIIDYITENPVPSTLNFYDADYLEKVLNGTQDKGKDDEDDEDEGRPRGGNRGGAESAGEDEEVAFGRRGSRRKSDDGADDDPLPDEEEEKPRGSRRAARDEEDEEADDDTPKRGSSRRASRDDDDDGEKDEPRRRGSRDDDDEGDDKKTRGRRANDAVDDEEEPDEKPSRRKSRDDDDEEEEKPRGKRARDAEEEEEENPRSRRKSRDDDDGEEEEEPEEKPRGKRTGRR
jgi:hypothetical protein